jgi:D-glycero-D-manno-heptose 1,7-bisphosphate phosphatase
MTNKTQPRPAIFIDRDGTMIEDADYLSRAEDMRIFDFTADALGLLKDKELLIVVITNQSGIARGSVTVEELHAIHKALSGFLPGMIDAFYHCPHAPGDGCRCRKPELGMIEQACRDLTIDIPNSWIVGDKRIDVETGFKAGMGTSLVLTGYGESEVRTLKRMPDIVADNLLEAARQISSRID